jgi:tetratricopeptide (TPR) repeat protein
VRLRPNFPDAIFMLGEALRKNRRSEASIEFYKRALDQDPDKFVYYSRLGGSYVKLGYSDKALDVFRRALKRFPGMPEAHYFVGIAARAHADYQLAESEFRESLQLQPQNVDTLAQLGFIIGERDRYAEAEKLLRSAIAINNKHFYANYDLGRLLVKSRRYEGALPILQHSARLKPNNPSVHYQLFMALSRLKRKGEADRELTIFKELDQNRKSNRKSDMESEDETLEDSSSPITPVIEPRPGKRPR